ncbi:MAG: ABC transporter permease subunit [Candidatus Niameybacter stercoravium]|nr:ABC transporter permease subunit [Candidatus Niameybacter stercoravium]
MAKVALVQGEEVKKPKVSLGTKIKKEWNRNKYVYALAIPLIAYYAIFHYGPMYGIVMAFQDYSIVDGISGSPFIGFDNFIKFFESHYFWRLIRNTLALSIQNILWGFPAPLILALLLNEVKRKKFKKAVQTITYLPHFISLVVVCGMLNQFLARDGFITNLLASLGLVEQTNLLAIKEYFRTIYVASGIWQEIGWGTIIYLAALSGVDEQLYEAAAIDGANRLKRLIHVTLPSIAPTIIMLLILRVGQVMSVGFEKVILLYNPQTYETADVLSTYIYRYGLGGSFDYGYTTAIGLFSSVINFVLVILANQFSKKVSETSLW